MRLLLLLAPLLSVSLQAAVAGQEAESTSHERPNVVLILTDDLGWGDLRCYNPLSAIPTPHLDRLAEEGMRFTDAHSPSAVCTPTRYSLLTGRYAWRSRLKKGVLMGYSANLIEVGRLTLASLLKQRNYHTACIGKWHLGLGPSGRTDYQQPLRPGPLEHGFDRFFGIPASLDMAPYLYVDQDRPLQAATETVAGSKQRRDGGGGYWRRGAIAPDFRHQDVLPRLIDESIRYLEGRAEEPDKPFFLYLPLTAPHTPWMPEERYQGRSQAGPYGDFVCMVDDQVGRLLAALDRLQLKGDTLVLFTSDNGAHWNAGDKEKYAHRANGPWRGQKADIHEGGHRVPFLARWPGRVPAGSIRSQILSHTDVMATLAALLEIQLPTDAGEDSLNQLPVLLGRAETPRTAVVHHSHQGMFAIRQGPWKLILGLGSGGFTPPSFRKAKDGEGEGQLYHLGEDRGESRSRYLEHPERVAELSALLRRYQETGRSRP
ncbi:MAG: hypothetical protein DWQ01_01200 [Planctomycetota bacterium]|nr:MAG: hypothetical protein DWQ01_01200 [Planctomycetota bacterium]